MVDVPFFKQDTRYSCGPTVMQMVFRFYGKIFSEEELVQKLKTNKETGVRHEEMVKLARAEGFDVYVNNGSSLAEVDSFIEKGLPVIVNFIEPNYDEGHYAIIVDLKGEQVVLNDPWNGKNFKMKREDFKKRWYSEDGSNKKWIMVVSQPALARES